MGPEEEELGGGPRGVGSQTGGEASPAASPPVPAVPAADAQEEEEREAARAVMRLASPLLEEVLGDPWEIADLAGRLACLCAWLTRFREQAERQRRLFEATAERARLGLRRLDESQAAIERSVKTAMLSAWQAGASPKTAEVEGIWVQVRESKKWKTKIVDLAAAMAVAEAHGALRQVPDLDRKAYLAAAEKARAATGEELPGTRSEPPTTTVALGYGGGP